MEKTESPTAISRAYLSRNAEETARLGAAIGARLKPGDLVLLLGELGSGKTTLVQGLCRGAGMDNRSWARSPTFTLINEYQARTPIRHADLYRVDAWEEFSTIGLFDPSFTGITLVEWGEKLPAGMEIKPALILRLREVSENEREIILEGFKSLVDDIMNLFTDR